MPTYGYQCTECEQSFEVFQSIKDEPLVKCENCGGKLKKLLYPVGIVFKGSGFHINDYKSDNRSISTPPETESNSPTPVKEPAKKTKTDEKTTTVSSTSK